MLFVTGGPSEEKWGESSFNFLPATSPRAAKRKSTLPWEAPGRAGGGGGCAQSVGMRDAGPARRPRAAPPCAPPLANGAWRGPAAAPTVLSPAANLRQLCISLGPRFGRRAPPPPPPPRAAPPAPPRPARPAQPGPPKPRPRGQAPAPRVSEPHASAPAAEGAPSPQLTCALDPGAARRGAGRRRVRPADSNFVALGTAQSSLPRGAGGAARRVTQQLARWRAGPCSRPLARPPAPLALRAPVTPAPTPPARRAHGCEGPRAVVRGACTPPGGCRAEEMRPNLYFQGWVWKVVLGFRDPSELGVPEETHPPHKQKGRGGGRESFSVSR